MIDYGLKNKVALARELFLPYGIDLAEVYDDFSKLYG